MAMQIAKSEIAELHFQQKLILKFTKSWHKITQHQIGEKLKFADEFYADNLQVHFWKTWSEVAFFFFNSFSYQNKLYIRLQYSFICNPPCRPYVFLACAWMRPIPFMVRKSRRGLSLFGIELRDLQWTSMPRRS